MSTSREIYTDTLIDQQCDKESAEEKQYRIEELERELDAMKTRFDEFQSKLSDQADELKQALDEDAKLRDKVIGALTNGDTYEIHAAQNTRTASLGVLRAQVNVSVILMNAVAEAEI